MMEKQGKRNFFLKCLMVLLAIGWSTSAVKAAPSYFRVEIIPVLENGAVGKLFACDNSSANSKYGNAAAWYQYLNEKGLTVNTGTTDADFKCAKV